MTRIELAYPAWEADVLPLNYTRLSAYNKSIYTDFPTVVKRKISNQFVEQSIWFMQDRKISFVVSCSTLGDGKRSKNRVFSFPVKGPANELTAPAMAPFLPINKPDKEQTDPKGDKFIKPPPSPCSAMKKASTSSTKPKPSEALLIPTVRQHRSKKQPELTAIFRSNSV